MKTALRGASGRDPLFPVLTTRKMLSNLRRPTAESGNREILAGQKIPDRIGLGQPT